MKAAEDDDGGDDGGDSGDGGIRNSQRIAFIGRMPPHNELRGRVHGIAIASRLACSECVPSLIYELPKAATAFVEFLQRRRATSRCRPPLVRSCFSCLLACWRP